MTHIDRTQGQGKGHFGTSEARPEEAQQIALPFSGEANPLQ